MDSQLSKDFLSSLFPHEAGGGQGSLQQPGQSQDHELQMQHALGLGLLHGSGGHQNQHVPGGQQLSLDMLFGPGQGMPPMGMHDASAGLQPSALDQQLKLARLRQLQVQHEILQQQVRPSGACSHLAILIPCISFVD
jgi:hypothetical protein